MRTHPAPIVIAAAALLASLLPPAAAADITLISSFNPSNNGTMCGAATSHLTADIYAYDCFGSAIQHYSRTGAFINSFSITAFGTANDVDVEIAPADLTMGGTFVPEGSVLFINGESGAAEIYALHPSTGALIATLNTAFGTSHVVGGAYHTSRGTFFLVQDGVPGGAAGNLVAEINPTTGAVINSFNVNPPFGVDFGDLDVSNVSGNLYLVSSDELNVGEFTPTGTFVLEHPLPGGVNGLRGIGIDDRRSTAWVAGSSVLFRLGGFPGPCLADYNGVDEEGDILDFLDFFDDFGACENQPAPCGSFGDPDVNTDGLVDILDFLDFLDAFGIGC